MFVPIYYVVHICNSRTYTVFFIPKQFVDLVTTFSDILIFFVCIPLTVASQFQTTQGEKVDDFFLYISLTMLVDYYCRNIWHHTIEHVYQVEHWIDIEVSCLLRNIRLIYLERTVSVHKPNTRLSYQMKVHTINDCCKMLIWNFAWLIKYRKKTNISRAFWAISICLQYNIMMAWFREMFLELLTLRFRINKIVFLVSSMTYVNWTVILNKT